MMLEALTGSTNYAASHRKGIQLPPGPPARWFWRNALPTVNIACTLTDLVREYGPVVSFRQGSKVIIVIGSVEAAEDIMEKEGASLVDRPRSIAAGEMLSNGMSLTMAGAGERFRRLRKAIHPHLQPKAAEAYQDMLRENAMDFILDVLNDPTNHEKHAQRFASSIVLRVTYGKSAPTAIANPEFVRLCRVVDNFQSVIRPGAYLVDRVPLLRYLPGYGKQIYKWHNEELELFRYHLRRVKSEVDQTQADPSLTKALLENTEEHQLSTDEMAYLAGTLFGAGFDTIVIAITTIIMAVACHPLAQAKVHEELDMVIGLDRAPTFNDSSSLPQLHAFIREALRWRPVVQIGFPHRATKDVLWKGHCIPKGATVYGCHWALSRDPIAFPDPEVFNPQRWFDSEGRLKDNNARFITYGFGRRVCPGLHFTNHALYIITALLMWSFRIAQRPDAPINTYAFSDRVTPHAEPFGINVIPRVEVAKLRAAMAG
ncbi:cytochrome P450 [Suillus fuscotomentosus]|uniref:Cytochrome P450 n=1 Tax=Suillus fuscotomentosus TaxID=1912939 RepID=A0AAD4EJL3_9AGAM|nr:cytochrome P450 [Suillus fuscotomentosus]KAG1907325.1 cytochrome P450 [Suillus fuscotomentosus]